MQLAEDALLSAWTVYDYSPQNGPVNVYQCTECGYFHFTSKGQMLPQLKEQWANGEILRQREANRWLQRLKKF